jgi:hypothetical protein
MPLRVVEFQPMARCFCFNFSINSSNFPQSINSAGLTSVVKNLAEQQFIIHSCQLRRPAPGSSMPLKSTSIAAQDARLASRHVIRSMDWTKMKPGAMSGCLWEAHILRP